MRHACHAEGCERLVPPRFLMCAKHWRMVSPELQAAIWKVYVPGQEERKDPSPLYLLVQRLAVVEVAVRTGVWDADEATDRVSRSWDLWIGEISDEERGWYVSLLPGGLELLGGKT